MKISIIITTYNAEAYIIDTLHSVINQTYQNFEVVIVDDGSIDQTVKTIQRYILDNSIDKVKLYPISHIGRASALNYAINCAQSDWIAIIDADDLWNVHKLALQIHYIKEKNLDFLATCSRIFHDNEQINIFETNYCRENITQLTPISLNKMLYANLIPHSSILTRRILIKYDQTRKSQIDYEMWLRLLHNGNKIYILNQHLLYHRIHSQQSFEARHHLRYAFSATKLQLKYCILNLKIFPIFFVICKYFYYIFLPRKIRFLIRDIVF